MNQTDIAYTRLHNLQLSQTAFASPAELVSWMGAMQAQDYAAAKWALGVRLRPTSDDAMELALDEGAILRTHMLRPTWHFVSPDDIRWILALTSPRVHATNASMGRQLELDAATLVRAADIMVAAVTGSNQMTRDELGDLLEANDIPARKTRLAYLVMWAELEALICSGPRRGKQFTYILLDERVPQGLSLKGEEALIELMRRYFQSHGPATDYDFARWSSLTLADTRRGLDALSGELLRFEVDGQDYWSSNATVGLRETASKAYLLSIFDEYTVGYKDRRAIGEQELGSALWAMGNALQYVVVLDSQVVGTWRRSLRKGLVTVELNLMIPLTDEGYEAVLRAAEEYGAFLGLTVAVV